MILFTCYLVKFNVLDTIQHTVVWQRLHREDIAIFIKSRVCIVAGFGLAKWRLDFIVHYGSLPRPCFAPAKSVAAISDILVTPIHRRSLKVSSMLIPRLAVVIRLDLLRRENTIYPPDNNACCRFNYSINPRAIR